MFDMRQIQMDTITSIRKAYGIQEDDKLIVYLGRIAEEKSIDIPIEGFRYVEDEHIKLMIVGDGPQLDDYRELAKNII